MCHFDITRTVNGRLRRGQQVTYALEPPLQHPCKFTVRINGAPAALGDQGAIRVNGIGAAGSVTITALTDNPWGSITFDVTCPECTASHRIDLPGGNLPPEVDPREEERRERYEEWLRERQEEREDDRRERGFRRRVGVRVPGLRITLFEIEIG